MTAPTFVHLRHLEIWRKRAQHIVDVAVAVDPSLNEFQLRSLRSYCRNEWIRLGGCWCIAAPRGESLKRGETDGWAAPLALPPDRRFHRVPHADYQQRDDQIGGNTVTEFRTLLHGWARKQLREQSSHSGSFEIENVYLDEVHGYSVENDYIEVNIQFRHTGCTLVGYDGSPCRTEGHWCMPDTTTTVKILNELLAS